MPLVHPLALPNSTSTSTSTLLSNLAHVATEFLLLLGGIFWSRYPYCTFAPAWIGCTLDRTHVERSCLCKYIEYQTFDCTKYSNCIQTEACL